MYADSYAMPLRSSCSDALYILNLKLLVSLNSVTAMQLQMSRSIFGHLTPKSTLCRILRSWNRLTEMLSVLIQTCNFSRGTQLLLNPIKWVQVPLSLSPPLPLPISLSLVVSNIFVMCFTFPLSCFQEALRNLLVMHICDCDVIFHFPVILFSGGFEEYINRICKTESGNKICARDEWNVSTHILCDQKWS